VTIWLLDTNAVSDIIKHPRGQVRQRINIAGEDNVFTSIIVACELRFGGEKRKSANLNERIDAALLKLAVQPLSADADHHYARLRCSLESKGTPIGQHDMLIAAHALSLDATLVTANTREFARIEGLKLENWLEG
jgi:tRNA(fMet)-specific endonuclease VapC